MIRHLISAVVTTILVVVTSVFVLLAQVKLPAAIEVTTRERVTRGSVTTSELVLSGAKVCYSAS